jgi:DNA-binding FadR family transcriptional regulator
MLALNDLKIRRDRLYEQVAESIERLIGSGKLKPGDQLPPEREFATNLNVSRTVVREAIRALAERGMVTIRPGQGVFVSEIVATHVSDQVGRLFRLNGSSYDEIVLVRRILEVEIAGLAAHNAEPTDLQEMQNAIDLMEETQESEERFVAADREFHAALARATKNKILPILLDAFADQLQEFMRRMFRVEGAAQDGLSYHKAIYEAVKKGNVDQARECMLQHLKQGTELALKASR